jgi:hypothetical protein
MKHGFIAVGPSGNVVKLEVPPVINDGTHRSLLSTPGFKTAWSPEAISFMSNVGGAGSEVMTVKAQAERYLQETNQSGQAAIPHVDVDTVLNSKPDLNHLYASPGLTPCDPHFHAAFKVAFHPANEYPRLTQRLLHDRRQR